jgi:hypothetical protein
MASLVHCLDYLEKQNSDLSPWLKTIQYYVIGSNYYI